MSIEECRSFEFTNDELIIENITMLNEDLDNLDMNLCNLSPTSSKGSISPSLFDDYEINTLQQIIEDELPAFRIQSLSPTGRSLSPINYDDIFEEDLESPRFNMAVSPDYDNYEKSNSINEDTMTLDEVHEKIGTPKSVTPNIKNLNLETIFEGVFLETPPKEKRFKSQFHQDY